MRIEIFRARVLFKLMNIFYTSISIQLKLPPSAFKSAVELWKKLRGSLECGKFTDETLLLSKQSGYFNMKLHCHVTRYFNK